MWKTGMPRVEAHFLPYIEWCGCVQNPSALAVCCLLATVCPSLQRDTKIVAHQCLARHVRVFSTALPTKNGDNSIGRWADCR
jgi:hypothetical protein